MTVSYSTYIEAPVEKVFDFFRDPRNWASAAPDARVRQSQVHVTEEGLGTFYVWSVRFPCINLEGFGVFVEFIPNERIVDKQSWAFEGTWIYGFKPEGSGTRLTMERHPRSFWRWRALDWLWYRVEGSMWEQYNEKLAHLLSDA